MYTDRIFKLKTHICLIQAEANSTTIEHQACLFSPPNLKKALRLEYTPAELFPRKPGLNTWGSISDHLYTSENSCFQCQPIQRAQQFTTAFYCHAYLTKNHTQNQRRKARAIPDSDSSAFLVLGAGEGDSLFSVLLCLGAKRQSQITQLQFVTSLHTFCSSKLYRSSLRKQKHNMIKVLPYNVFCDYLMFC